MGNSNMHKSKRNKNDEFYTRLSDIERELRHYRQHFEGKHIFMNCDDPKESNFWKYFYLNFDFFGLKQITSTHYDEEVSTYRLDYDGKSVVKTPLIANGDFRSPEAIEVLMEADLVITNPPFSLYREYVAQLIEYEKDFLIIGNYNSITYKEIFPLIKDNKMWVGMTPRSMTFDTPEGTEKTVNACWFTNLDIPRLHEEIILYREYDEEKYPKYDNYDAIEVSKVNEIPEDYDGVMGVPITYLTKHNPDQFEIVKFRKGDDNKDLSVNGRTPYFRILIKRKDK